MPSATTQAGAVGIHIHPKGGEDFSFAVDTDANPGKAGWVSPNCATYFALACSARSTGMKLAFDYTTFIDQGPAQFFYQGVSNVRLV